MKNQPRLKDLTTLFWAFAAALIQAIAYASFIERGNFYPTGFSGMARLFTKALQDFAGISISYAVLVFFMNLIATIIVFRHIGRRFAIFSMCQVFFFSLLVSHMPAIITVDDPILLAIFGGIVNGFGCGLALAHDLSTGGMDFFSVYISNRYNKSAWNYIFAINTAILVIAGCLYGFEIALYSVIMQYCQKQVISTLHKRYTHQTLTIITTKPQEVIDNILKGTRHGITILKGEGAYLHKEETVLYMVVNTFQTNQIIKAAREMDEGAFINIQDSKGVSGNYYRLPLE